MSGPQRSSWANVVFEVPRTKEGRTWSTITGRVLVGPHDQNAFAGLVTVERAAPLPTGVQTTDVPWPRVIKIDYLPAPPDQTPQEG
ncbi:hypothetical protein [Tomitella cavernea]|uniref:Uncharacterized protein n=1 Tax=Tomitella cavernea TaxID=1387982 RepID=A0ABP9CFL2_9ACTN|nr:hypothetical protein [Tomitella cavernea]